MPELDFDDVEEAWIKSIRKNPIEQDHIRWLTAQVAAKFLITQQNDATAVAEVVLLGWSPDAAIKNATLAIIRHISELAEETVNAHAANLQKSLAVGVPNKLPRSYPLMSRLPLPATSPLLAKALKIFPEEYTIHRLRVRRLNEYAQIAYISPQVKLIIRKPDEDEDDQDEDDQDEDDEDEALTSSAAAACRRAIAESEEEISAERFSLLDKVKEFLDSTQQVFLIMGDSRVGMSTFNRYLENVLWKAYKQGDPIPLFINLLTIEKPQKELISEYLRNNKFSEKDIPHLKDTRQFIVICDSYDESQLTINLHSTNDFNRPGEWDTKMIISCRSTYLHKGYRDQFQPQPLDNYSLMTPYLFQEVAIVPFSSDQIEAYVGHFLQETKVHE